MPGGVGTTARAPEPIHCEPHVAASVDLPEFTARAVITGCVLGIVFGAANAYLGLKTGLTVSTSIPIAVMTVAAFRLLQAAGSGGGILEANMSQTIGSASSSVASGVIFTIPALFLWQMDPTLARMTLLAICGGILGTLFMIPLRRPLIVVEHGRLPYPEGTACARVLMAADAGGARARNVFIGLGAGALLKTLTGWVRAIKDDLHVRVPFLPKGEIGMEISGALFGVGYILGPRIGSTMAGGGLLSSLVIIPALAVWGAGRTEPLYPETALLIPQMEPGQLWSRYIRYIGAGAVATGGLITLIRSIPMMVASFRSGARQIFRRIGETGLELGKAPLRTERDLSLATIGIGSLAVALTLAAIPGLFGEAGGVVVRIAGAALIVLFAFFFVTVSSRIVGLVGVTSNPTSGMTIASLLGTSAVFLAFGWTDAAGKAAALCVGCVVAIAASIGGDTSQDLKTGFLLGATPRRQQIGQLLGVLTSAAFVCLTVITLDKSYGFGTQDLPAPQATLMKLVIEGVLDRSLPWALVGIGVLIAVACELLRIPSLPFAVGVYLPLATMTPVFLGGLLRHWLERSASSPEEAATRKDEGVLFGSGLVGGEGLLGVGIAATAAIAGAAPAGIGPEWAGDAADWLALVAFGLLTVLFVRSCTRSRLPA